jgi:hypothetical protein
MTSYRNLCQLSCLWGTQWFMQDSPTPLTVNVVSDFQHTVSHQSVILHGYPERHSYGHFWPPVSPDLNPDFLLWGFMKDKMFPKKPDNLMDLWTMIVQFCQEISEDMCRRVIKNIDPRLQEAVQQNSGHTEHVINWGHFTRNSASGSVKFVTLHA